MSKLQKISNTHYRIVCECGVAHEIKADDKGEIVLTTFAAPKKKSDTPMREDIEPGGKRRKSRNLFGSLLEDEEAEDEEGE